MSGHTIRWVDGVRSDGDGLPWEYDDGGRAESGRKGDASDCVVRAVAIATGIGYGDVYELVAKTEAAAGRARSARNGVDKRTTRKVLAELGWGWTPTMHIGSGCTVHLAVGELPSGRLVVNCSGHLVAVVDGVVRDTHDPTRAGTRCVYGYWSAP